MRLDDRQLATVLAALRGLQVTMDYLTDATLGEAEEAVHDVATCGGTLQPLDTGEIDDLCEALNAEPAPLQRWDVWFVAHDIQVTAPIRREAESLARDDAGDTNMAWNVSILEAVPSERADPLTEDWDAVDINLDLTDEGEAGIEDVYTYDATFGFCVLARTADDAVDAARFIGSHLTFTNA